MINILETIAFFGLLITASIIALGVTLIAWLGAGIFFFSKDRSLLLGTIFLILAIYFSSYITLSLLLLIQGGIR